MNLGRQLSNKYVFADLSMDNRTLGTSNNSDLYSFVNDKTVLLVT